MSVIFSLFLFGPGARAGWFSANTPPSTAKIFIDVLLETWVPPSTFDEVFANSSRSNPVANKNFSFLDVADEIETRLSAPSDERTHALLTLWIGAQHVETVYRGAPPITVFPLRRALADPPYPRVRQLAALLLSRREQFNHASRPGGAEVQSRRFYERTLQTEREPYVRQLISAIIAGERVAPDNSLLSELASCASSLQPKTLGSRWASFMR